MQAPNMSCTNEIQLELAVFNKNDPKLWTWWLSVNNLLYALKLIGCVWQRVLSPGDSV